MFWEVGTQAQMKSQVGRGLQKLSAITDQGLWPGAWTELLGLNLYHRLCP